MKSKYRKKRAEAEESLDLRRTTSEIVFYWIIGLSLRWLRASKEKFKKEKVD